MNEHTTDIKNSENNVMGTHFNSVGHDLSHFTTQVIEKVTPNTTHTLLERERMWILKFRTVLPLGLNSHP